MLAKEMNQKGIQYVQKKQLSKAEFYFEEAIRADQCFGPAYNNLGLVFYHQHDFFEAARAFEAASEHLPNNPEPLNNLGLVMESVARPEDGIELYLRAHEMAPTNAEYLGNLVRARIRMKQIDDELLAQLHALLLFEKRTEWQDWAREQLALLHNPELDRGPAISSNDPLGELRSKSENSTESNKPRSLSLPAEAPPPSPAQPSTLPDNDLRMLTVPPEELPRLESVPSLPSLPSTRSPTPAPMSAYPSALPPPARFPSSILEPLE